MPASSTTTPEHAGRRRLRTVAALAGISALTFAAIGIAAERSGAVAPAAATATRPAATALATPVFSARRTPDAITRPQARRRLAAALSPIIEQAPANTCVMVSDETSSVFEHRADLPLAPASNQKLITAQAALGVLGPDATRATLVAVADDPDDGTVDGDMWLIGGGDPVIDTETYQQTQKYGPSPHTSLEDIADEITAAGVRRVTGSLIGDETRYDDARTVETWPNRYVTQNQVGPLSALAVNDAKTYSAVVSGGRASPAADPAAYAASALTELLVARGVSVGGAPRSGTAPDDLRTLVEHPSLPVTGLVEEMLTFSDNNTAELLVKEMGVTAGEDGSTAAGLAAASDQLDAIGIDMDGAALVDGSGLATGNRITCRQLDGVLGADGPEGPLASGLARAGETGTLRDRFTDSPAVGRVTAKTGTLNSVTSLSGWATTLSNVQVRFSILANAEGRTMGVADQRVQERLVEALLSYPDRVDPVSVAPESVE